MRCRFDEYGKTKGMGFTLIELMIVVLIVGILSGVLISVIDPAKQRDRARDGVTRAALIKLASGIEGYKSAYGRLPNDLEFRFSNLVDGFQEFSSSCGSQEEAFCLFSTPNIQLRDKCRYPYYAGTNPSGQQCVFLYCGGDEGDGNGVTYGTGADGCKSAAVGDVTQLEDYRIFAASWESDRTFMYRSKDSKLYLCDGTWAAEGPCEEIAP